MVLDVKAMEWASANGIDTAKLKAAKIPIYGKWYFPDIPPGVLLVNLQNGQLQRFGPGMVAGEVLFVKRDDLRAARLGPYATWEDQPPESKAAAPPTAPVVVPSRVSLAPPLPRPTTALGEPLDADAPIHMPKPSVYPLVFGLGLAIALLGFVAGPLPVRVLIVVLGLIYLLAGSIGWVLENHHQDPAAEAEGQTEHAGAAAE